MLYFFQLWLLNLFWNSNFFALDCISAFKVASFRPKRKSLSNTYHKQFLSVSTSPTGLHANMDEGNTVDDFMSTVLFIECGFGNDSHGQNATKAAVRACRNAIEFNSIPSVRMLVPGGYDNLKLVVHLAVPEKYQEGLDLEQCANVFPYGNVKFVLQNGGMVAPSGVAIEKLGDKNDDMVVVCCSVMVGY